MTKMTVSQTARLPADSFSQPAYLAWGVLSQLCFLQVLPELEGFLE